MIVKVGGTNGSGKTSLARAFMKLWTFVPVVFPGRTKVSQYVAQVRPGQPLARLFNKIVLLGSYASVCGGMDTITDKDVRFGLVEQYCSVKDRRTLVMNEGLLTGTTYGAMGDLSERSKVPWLYVFMDTPYEVCLARTISRREARGNFAPLDGEKHLHPKIRACESVAVRAAAAGHSVYWVDHKLKPDAQARRLLKEIERAAK